MFKVFPQGSSNFWLFIFFALGIISGFYFPYFFVFLPLFLSSSIFVFIFSKRLRFLLSDICISIMFMCIGALWYLPCNYQNMDNFLGEGNNVVLQVASMPKDNIYRNVFAADIKEINGIKFSKRVKVVDYSRTLEYLNDYAITARLSKVIFENKDFYTLWIKSDSAPKELNSALFDKLNRDINFRTLDILKTNLSEQSYRFIASVFMGRRELLSKEEKDAFTNAGISHLLAISGSNIGLAALVLFFIFKIFNMKFRACLFVSVLFLFAYTIITGANPPTLRAAIMYGVFSLSFFIKRKLNPFNSLGLAGFLCLLINPSWVFDVGFQLSFLSIFALILGFKLFPVKQSNVGLLNQLKYLFFSSLYVTIAITPLISYYFGRIYILSVFNNILLIPFFTFILIINFAMLIFSPFKFIAQSIAAVLSLLIPLFYKLSQFLGSIKLSFITCQFCVKTIFIYYIFAVIFIFLFKKIRTNPLVSNGLTK